MDQVAPTVITVVSSIVGLAMLAVLLSKRADTSAVIQSGGSALSSVIAAAVAPLGAGNNNGTAFGSAPAIGGPMT